MELNPVFKPYKPQFSVIKLHIVNRLLNQFLTSVTEFIVYSRINVCTVNKFF